MDEKKENEVQEIEIEPLSDEALDSASGGNEISPQLEDGSSGSCCSCSGCS